MQLCLQTWNQAMTLNITKTNRNEGTILKMAEEGAKRKRKSLPPMSKNIIFLRMSEIQESSSYGKSNVHKQYTLYMKNHLSTSQSNSQASSLPVIS